LPGDPADKAGVKLYDVLLKVDDKALENGEELIHAVDKAKETKLKLDVIRGGKPLEITVTPSKRPLIIELGKLHEQQEQMELAQKALAQIFQHMQAAGREGPVQFSVAGPGVILPLGAPLPPPMAMGLPKLPQNTSVMISKEGDKPAQIVVKQGDKKWEISEKQLDKLPEKLRPVVARMLGHGPVMITPDDMPESMRAVITTPAPGGNVFYANPNVVTYSAHAGGGQPGLLDTSRLEMRLDQLSRQIDQLRRSVDELREHHPRRGGDEGRPPERREPPPPPHKRVAPPPPADAGQEDDD
jgi:hypothetical protein